MCHCVSQLQVKYSQMKVVQDFEVLLGWKEIVQEVVASIGKSARAQVDAKQTAHRIAGAKCQAKLGLFANQKWRRGGMRTSKKRNRWKCNGLRMKRCKRSLNEEERKDVPCSLQMVPELVVHEQMSQGEKQEVQKKVKGWSTEEMKNEPRDDRKEDTEEMIEWRSMSQEEMDQRGFGQVQVGRQQER